MPLYLVRDDRHPGDKAHFEAFIPFVKVDQAVRGRFIAGLRRLHELSGTMWQPGIHFHSRLLGEQINTQHSAGNLPDIENARVRSFSSALHMFVVVNCGPVENLVIDPYGMPTPNNNPVTDPRSSLPFFGDPAQGSEVQHYIYTNAHSFGILDF